jgi:hypothetical protein
MKSVRLIVLVNTEEQFHSLMQIPKMVSKNGVKTHYATMQGLQFMMYLGSSSTSIDNQNIFKGINGNVVFVTLDISSTSIIQNIASGLSSSVRAVGALKDN